MSVTGPTEDPELLRIWLCNGCYGRNVYHLYDHGYLSVIDTNVKMTTRIVATITGRSPVTLLSRNYTKHALYKMDYFNNHGLVFGAIADAPNLSLWSGIPGANECWGDITDEYDGKYDVANSFVNTQIYYADLREDILVYFKEEGSYTGSVSHNKPLGFRTVFADFGGEKPACKSIWILDAIPLSISLHATGTSTEHVTLGGYVPYTEDTGGSATVETAASDRSGYCGGVNGFDCYVWGNYQVVDTAVQLEGRPCSCPDGECPDTVIPYDLNNLFNSFDSFGVLRQIDDYDYSLWSETTDGWGSGRLNTMQPGTYDYPNFINIDPLPKGSFVTDAAGNYFHSMITRDMKTFNRLNTTDPNSVTSLPGNGIVFYPVAPV